MKRMERLAGGEPRISPALIDQVRSLARPLGGPDDLSPLLDVIGDARYVLLGEASHGTDASAAPPPRGPAARGR